MCPICQLGSMYSGGNDGKQNKQSNSVDGAFSSLGLGRGDDLWLAIGNDNWLRLAMTWRLWPTDNAWLSAMTTDKDGTTIYRDHWAMIGYWLLWPSGMTPRKCPGWQWSSGNDRPSDYDWLAMTGWQWSAMIGYRLWQQGYRRSGSIRLMKQRISGIRDKIGFTYFSLDPIYYSSHC